MNGWPRRSLLRLRDERKASLQKDKDTGLFIASIYTLLQTLQPTLFKEKFYS